VHPVKRLFAREALADTWLTTHEPANDVVRSGRAAREFQPERGGHDAPSRAPSEPGRRRAADELPEGIAARI
ncbi:hypothetical protein AURDEDRAFT_177115, partial [Auricularia subglabra TFB-10046 SS5]